jgi:hypothetical protein
MLRTRRNIAGDSFVAARADPRTLPRIVGGRVRNDALAPVQELTDRSQTRFGQRS